MHSPHLLRLLATQPVALPTRCLEGAVDLLPDAELDPEHGVVELHHGQPHLVANARLPVLRKTLLRQQRSQVLQLPAEDCEQS